MAYAKLASVIVSVGFFKTLRFYWLMAACRFWSTAKLPNSDLLVWVIKLGSSGQASWSV